MKNIQPVIFPLNLGTATILNCVGSDNFSTSVTIYYQLLSSENQTLQSGNLNLSGADYKAYNTSADGNQYIYEWSATQLGVTIIGDYVPPMPEPIAEIYVGEPSVLEVEPRSSVLGQIRQDAPIDEIVTE